MKRIALFAMLALAGCASAPASPRRLPAIVPVASSFASATIGIGGTAVLGQVVIRPIAVLEDSRCPPNVQCIWAGRVRLLVELGGESDGRKQEMTLGQLLPLAEGQLSLSDVQPTPMAGATPEPRAYRFTFTLTRGP